MIKYDFNNVKELCFSFERAPGGPS
jgi:hypothetical protein